MRQAFDRAARAAVAGAVLAIILPASAAPAVTTPPGEKVRTQRIGVLAGIADADIDAPRCRDRRDICRRYPTDARTIRCLERFGCFTGPRFD